jgi:uncharacterized surface protein with fasciclin (FAS1) repeats
VTPRLFRFIGPTGLLLGVLSQKVQQMVTELSSARPTLSAVSNQHSRLPTMLLRQNLCIALSVGALGACAARPAPVSVAETLAATPQLSTLSSLIAKTGLTDTLKSTGPFTVFAPSNDAFAKVPAKTMDELGKDPAKLKAVLTYHVVAGKVMAADVKNGNSKTVNGANIALSKAGEFVTVEDAMVQTADISATNGVVHVVDSVLIPPATR